MFARRIFSSGSFRRRGRLGAACCGLLVSSWLIAASANAATAGANTAAAAQPFVPTPAQLLGPLFVQVQMDALYPDGKTFADAVPKAPPPTILRRYRSARPRSRAALLRFVNANFSFPTEANTPPAQADKTLAGHIARLWPLLTRRPVVPRPYSSLLYVPQPYVVPGGRFREMYYWDSYFTMLGLGQSSRVDLIGSMVADLNHLQ